MVLRINWVVSVIDFFYCIIFTCSAHFVFFCLSWVCRFVYNFLSFLIDLFHIYVCVCVCVCHLTSNLFQMCDPHCNFWVSLYVCVFSIYISIHAFIDSLFRFQERKMAINLTSSSSAIQFSKRFLFVCYGCCFISCVNG